MYELIVTGGAGLVFKATGSQTSPIVGIGVEPYGSISDEDESNRIVAAVFKRAATKASSRAAAAEAAGNADEEASNRTVAAVFERASLEGFAMISAKLDFSASMMGPNPYFKGNVNWNITDSEGDSNAVRISLVLGKAVALIMKGCAPQALQVTAAAADTTSSADTASSSI